MKIPEVKGKTWTIFITMLLLSLGLMYYFFVYVKGNEQELNERCYRDINRIADNFKEKSATFNKNAQEIVYRSFDNFRNNTPEMPAPLKYQYFYNDIENNISNIKSEKGLNPALDYCFSYDTTQKRKITGNPCNDAGMMTFIARSFKVEYKLLKNLHVVFSTDTKTFLEGLFKNTIFDSYFLTSIQKHAVRDSLFFNSGGGHQKIYSQRKGNLFNSRYMGTEPSKTYNPGLSAFDILIPDSLKNKDRFELTIGGIDYIVFAAQIPAHINSTENHILYGLITKQKYNKLHYQFNSWLIFLITAILFIVLLTIPVIKIVSLSPVEELSKNDLFFMLLSVCMGLSIVMLLLLTLFSTGLFGNKEVDNDLKNLSGKITANFLDELHEISTQLDYFDKDLQLKTKNSVDFSSFNIPDILNNKNYSVFYDNMKLVFWLDTFGKQRAVYSRFPDVGTFSDLSHRDYFKHVMQDNMWIISNNNQFMDTLTLESIRSVSSGECLAAISKKSRVGRFVNAEIKVVALTAPLQSLINTALPFGKQFCVVDQKGEVWFHSDNTFNTQENFLDECNRDAVVLSAITTREAHMFTCKYKYKTYRCHIQPIQGTPLSIITLYDKTLSGSFLSQVLSLAFMLTLLSLIAIFFQSLILRWIHATPSDPENLIYPFQWLKFSNKKEKAFCYKQLIYTNLSFISIVLLLNIIANRSAIFSKSFAVISTVSASILTIALNYYILQANHVTIFRNPFRNGYYVLLTRKLMFFIISIVFLAAIIGLSYNIHHCLVDILAIVMQCGLFILIWTFLNFSQTQQNMAGFIPKDNEKYNGIIYYYGFIITLITVVSIIPAILSFKVSYDFENEISDKYKLFENAHNYTDVRDRIDTYRGNSLKPEDTPGTRGIYIPAKLLRERGPNNITGHQNLPRIAIEPSGKEPHLGVKKQFSSVLLEQIIHSNHTGMDFFAYLFTKKMTNSTQTRYEDSIYAQISPRFGTLSKLNKDFILDWASDRSWSFDPATLIFKTTLPDNTILEQKADIQKFGLGLVLRKNHAIIDLISILILSLLYFVALFFLIRFLCHKLFGLQITLKVKKHSSFDQKILENDFIYLTGLSGSGKNKLLPTVQNPGSDELIIDIKQIDEQEAWQKLGSAIENSEFKKIVIDHFEYDLYNMSAWDKKLSLVSKLYRNNKKVILLSQIHPNQIFRIYETCIESEKTKATQNIENKHEEYLAKFYKWQQILDRYVMFFQPLVREDILDIIKLPEQVAETEIPENTLVARYNNITVFTFGLRNERTYFRLSPYNTKKLNPETEIIPEHQVLHNYYHSIWYTIPLEEKYILFDFARDGLINSNNRNAIENLMNKGILINDGSIAMINTSFRNFILNSLKPKEELDRTRQILLRGRWNTFRIVILLVILALFTLLWYGNQDFIMDFKAILLALTAIAVSLIKFRNIAMPGSKESK